MKSDVPDPHAVPKGSNSRAGRDLPAAIGVGVTLIALIGVSLFVVKDVFAIVVAAALTIGVFELANAFGAAGIRLPRIPVVTGGVAAMAAAYLLEDTSYALVILAITVLAVLIGRLPLGAEGFLRDVSAGLFVLGYLFLMGVLVMRMLAAEDGQWRIVAFIACTVASDIGGYAVGVLFGKHPMAPSISPKKSWEGFAGSFAFGVGLGILVVVYAFAAPWWIGIILGAACVVAGTVGDLCESLIKRDLGIKDMGNILPGHGGIMDRLDSLIVAAPVAFIVLYLFV